MKYIDLFCGIGSFHLAMDKYNHECVFSCDINPHVRKTYEINHKMAPHGDIKQIHAETIPPHDILCAGIPCQSFSTIGLCSGFAQESGTMFDEVMRVVKHHKPKYVVLENVKGLTTINNGKYFNQILASLHAEGYQTSHRILNAKHYGIPQSRERIFIVATLGEPVSLDFPHHKPCNLTEYLNVGDFERDTSYTIRCEGRYSKFEDKSHNWSKYMKDGRVYQLKLEDALRLQGFPENFHLSGHMTHQWRQIGNTIPTNLTELVVSRLK